MNRLMSTLVLCLDTVKVYFFSCIFIPFLNNICSSRVVVPHRIPLYVCPRNHLYRSLANSNASLVFRYSLNHRFVFNQTPVAEISQSFCSLRVYYSHRNDSGHHESASRVKVRLFFLFFYNKKLIVLLSVITELIIGYMLPGKPIAMMMFKTWGYIVRLYLLAYYEEILTMLLDHGASTSIYIGLQARPLHEELVLLTARYISPANSVACQSLLAQCSRPKSSRPLWLELYN